MHYVILRDDDTNALTPVECLEKLYRPFLDKGLPVNLATIPNVATSTRVPSGELEGFLMYRNGKVPPNLPIGHNAKLVRYLLDNPGYQIVQHGYDHDYFEFECRQREEISRRLDRGTRLLMEAGFPKPETFVAPYDKFSRNSFGEVARRFRVISGGWYELRRLPLKWWPKYLLKKITQRPHWRTRQTALLSHPGCLLSSHRAYESMLDQVRMAVESNHMVVLVTHWWEYFKKAEADEVFISFLHATADYLAKNDQVRVITFKDIADGKVRV